jgi:hypothetical protein
MKLMIEVSVGDFIDRLSILEIKLQHGLNVDQELQQYSKLQLELEELGFGHYKNLLFSINSRLWLLEDQKREFTDRNSETYANVAELITQLNDLRFAVKKKADEYFKSSISEKKSHS